MRPDWARSKSCFPRRRVRAVGVRAEAIQRARRAWAPRMQRFLRGRPRQERRVFLNAGLLRKAPTRAKNASRREPVWLGLGDRERPLRGRCRRKKTGTPRLLQVN